MTKKYWINTGGNKLILFLCVGFEPDKRMTLMYELKECNAFTYYLFKYTRINLLAKDKFKWLREKLNGYKPS